MKNILLVSRNEGKFWNACMDLGDDYHVKRVSNLYLPERESTAPLISESKAKMAYKKLDKPVITVDGAFYVPMLENYPGVHCNIALKSQGVEGILEMLEDKKFPTHHGTVNLNLPQQDNFLELAQHNSRFCYFVDALSYMDERLQKPITFVAIHDGYVSYEPRGIKPQWAWSDLWKIFQPTYSKKTLAEMDKTEFQEYQKVSPSCFQLFKEWQDWADTYPYPILFDMLTVGFFDYNKFLLKQQRGQGLY
ncbi:MAG: non-canonical purine NTP pyrophosphatase [archaeon]